jgi:hypothetical protein
MSTPRAARPEGHARRAAIESVGGGTNGNVSFTFADSQRRIGERFNAPA